MIGEVITYLFGLKAIGDQGQILNFGFRQVIKLIPYIRHCGQISHSLVNSRVRSQVLIHHLSSAGRTNAPALQFAWWGWTVTLGTQR
ncbi:hypothetical protein NIES932_27460 [Raphidiopsis curvata NIES-932]|nr:hypothetical protein NIES932_27460 [Raphidiopsis curvata NIES-932]